MDRFPAYTANFTAFIAVVVFPIPGLELALDADLAALDQVLAGGLGGLAPADDAVPLDLLLGVAVLVLPPLVGGEAQLADGLAGLGVLELGVTAEVTDQRDAVEGHRGSLRLRCRCRPATPGDG